ncbi:MAG: glycosyl hydrolase family 28-related protein, partial [Polyangiales bacterium]
MGEAAGKTGGSGAKSGILAAGSGGGTAGTSVAGNGSGGISGSGGHGGTGAAGANAIADAGAGTTPSAGLSNDILPDDRRVTWAPGIPGGIPTRNTICASAKDAPYGAVGDGMHDDTTAIQAAIDACPEGQVVHLPAGTYRVTQTVYLLKDVVLRGDGPSKTMVEGDGVPDWAILNLGEHWDESNTPITPVMSGYDKGSKSVVVADASHFAVGDLWNIDQLNDEVLVRVEGSESACTYGSRDNGMRLIGQIVEVTSVDTASGAIGFEPGLAVDYHKELMPEAERVHSHIVRHAGIEDLKVSDRTYRGDNQANVRIHACAYCWARNIDSDMVSGRHIQVVRSFRSNVESSFVHHAHCYNPGANAYGIAVERQTSDSLVQDNIVYYLNVGIVLASAGPDNVIAYNYGDVMWESNYPNTNWLMADFSANHCG